MNRYLNKLVIGDFLLGERDEVSARIGERLTHSLVEYQIAINQKTGFGMRIHIFSC